MERGPLLLRLALVGVFALALTGMAQADTNLALGGTATQSSTYVDSYATLGAGNAIDGLTDGNIYNGSVTHTYADPGAWWKVDLGKAYDLNQIVLWNRTAGNSDVDGRLSNFVVSVLDDKSDQVWAHSYFTTGGYPNPSLTIDLPSNILGEFVKVQLNGTDYLSLAEVQVFGTTAVPEPFTLIFLGGCLIGVGTISMKSKI